MGSGKRWKGGENKKPATLKEWLHRRMIPKRMESFKMFLKVFGKEEV